MSYTAVTPSIPFANLAWRLARQRCGACRAYHAIWPYLRLAGPPRGIDADRDALLPILTRLIRGEARILVAGSADAGPVELIAEAAGANRTRIDAIDLCDTPLAQCRRLSLPRNLDLSTRVQSLVELDSGPVYDLIVAHSVLSFLPRSQIDRAGRCLAAALAPRGSMVLTTHVGEGKGSGDSAAFKAHALAQLALKGVALPDSCFEAMLEDHYIERNDRRSTVFADNAALLDWLARSGLELVEHHIKARGTVAETSGGIATRVSEGALIVARRSDTAPDAA